jgi:hypothetical protein
MNHGERGKVPCSVSQGVVYVRNSKAEKRDFARDLLEDTACPAKETLPFLLKARKILTCPPSRPAVSVLQPV